MTFIKTASAAVMAATIAFGAMAPISAPAFASDQGVEVPPVKNIKKSPNKVRFANLDKYAKKKAKYFAIGAAVGMAGYALLKSAYNDYRN